MTLLTHPTDAKTATGAPAQLATRQTLRLCTAGSVDDGKSTFVGRLLHDTKSVLADQLSAVERTSRERGHEGLDFSLLVDGLRAEREQGITIDVAYRYFSTAERTFILADTPGHVQYTRNTVTGVSTSQVVVLLVDARRGVVTQTRRHLTVAALLGIRQVVLAVNKIDLVGYFQDVFEQIREEFTALARDKGIAEVTVIPISALRGDNVVEPSANTPWYTGPTVLHYLETVEVADQGAETGLRLPIQYVIRPQGTDYRGYAGRITGGHLAVGDTVHLGQGRTSTVTHIDTADGDVATATTGDSIVVRLADDIDLSRGDLIAGADRPEGSRELTATLVGLADTPLRPGAKVKLRYGTSLVRARLVSIDSLLDIDTNQEHPGEAIELNDIATVTLQLAEDLPTEPYSGRGLVGSLLLINQADGNTLAAGLVR
ncbi:sulfate adenylyltransferase [Rothia nasimurium]|uniref:sulfate adenylyltransferase n=1 Tax=Rothia nasimurium TaxID=85336 RepID=A0A1Y1RRW7_9MICC|nr:GTP-binding protein [Rothia nasimurium]ORC22131.1 sulfate adenylyltransferase [Rothia nasimurium]